MLKLVSNGALKKARVVLAVALLESVSCFRRASLPADFQLPKSSLGFPATMASCCEITDYTHGARM
jgi:hypothetical protein